MSTEITDNEVGTEDDGLEPFCATCAAAIGIFPGYGEGWRHFRGEGTVASPVELYDVGHAPALGWREAGQ